jgi:hypothetical protein
VILCRDLVDIAESARDRFLIFSSIVTSGTVASVSRMDGIITAACVTFVSLSEKDNVYINHRIMQI